MVVITGTCYWNHRYCQSCTVLLVTHKCSSRIAPRLTALATPSSYCSRRHPSSLHQTCGCQTAQTWTRSGVSYRNEFIRLQCVTQLTSSDALLRLGPAFHRLSSTKPLTSGLRLRAWAKAQAVTNLLLSEPPNATTLLSAHFRATHILLKEISYAFVCLNISNILLTHIYTQHTVTRI